MPSGEVTRLVAETPGWRGGHDELAGRGLGAAVQLEGEEQVGQLAVAVVLVGVVRRLRVALEHGLVAPVVGDRGDRDHAGRRAWSSAGQQQPGEREVAEVVGAELELVAVLGLAVLRRRHHAGVVDQQVERALEPVGEGVAPSSARPGRAPRRTVAPGISLATSRAGVGVAAGQHDLGAVLGERAGGVEADAGVGAGDHGAGAGQVGQVVGVEAGEVRGGVMRSAPRVAVFRQLMTVLDVVTSRGVGVQRAGASLAERAADHQCAGSGWCPRRSGSPWPRA